MVIFHSYVKLPEGNLLGKKHCPFELFKAFKADLQQPIFPAELLGASSDQLIRNFLRNALPRTIKDFKQQQDGYVSQTVINNSNSNNSGNLIKQLEIEAILNGDLFTTQTRNQPLSPLRQLRWRIP